MSFFGRQPVNPVIEEMAEALRTDRIKANLDRLGICEISGAYLGKAISVSWYAGGKARDIVFDGSRYFCTGDEAEQLLSAAKQRAEHLFTEKVAELNALRAAALPRDGQEEG